MLVATRIGGDVEFERRAVDDPRPLTADQAAFRCIRDKDRGWIYVTAEHDEFRFTCDGNDDEQLARTMLRWELLARDLPERDWRIPTALTGAVITPSTPAWMARAIEEERAAVLRQMERDCE